MLGFLNDTDINLKAQESEIESQLSQYKMEINQLNLALAERDDEIREYENTEELMMNQNEQKNEEISNLRKQLKNAINKDQVKQELLVWLGKLSKGYLSY